MISTEHRASIPSFGHRVRWNVSSLFYRRVAQDESRLADSALFGFLGGRVWGSVVADCGSGPGELAEEFLRRGAAKVLAIDSNPRMNKLAQDRLRNWEGKGRLRTVFFDHGNLGNLSRTLPNCTGFDIIVFKRSLYARKPKACLTIREAANALRNDGVLVLIHPERSFMRYAFGHPPRLRNSTPFHVFNRTVSAVAARLGIGGYQLYSCGQLLDLLAEAGLEMRQAGVIESHQAAYNLVYYEKKSQG